jgi:hypothetical protein
LVLKVVVDVEPRRERIPDPSARQKKKKNRFFFFSSKKSIFVAFLRVVARVCVAHAVVHQARVGGVRERRTRDLRRSEQQQTQMKHSFSSLLFESKLCGSM